MIWQPLNLTAACPVNSQITVCGPLGYLFVHLVTQLYGDSEDRRIQEKLARSGWSSPAGDIVHGEEEFDFIVVGAGTAGCVVANRLTEISSWKVLLLEAGPEEPDVTLVPGFSETLLSSNVDWNYATQPNKGACLSTNGVCTWSRGKMMGGTSAFNTMVAVRGNRVDYDTWASLGNQGWSYNDVLPYFKKSEKNLNIESQDRKYHGVHGPQTVSRYPYIDQSSLLLTQAYNEMGLPIVDFDGASQYGTKQAQAFSEDGQRVSTNTAYIRPIRYKRKNLTVRPNSEVVKILIDNDKRAYGVKYVTNGKIHFARVRKDVIVSGGTINSAKLLLQSGIGPKEHLNNAKITVVQDSAVGENLQDHITFGGLIIAFDNTTSTMVDDKTLLDDVVEFKYMKTKRGHLASTGIFNSVAFYKTDDTLSAPDIQIQPGILIRRDYLKEPTTYGSIRLLPTSFYDAAMPRVQNLVTKSRGRLLLNISDPNGPPIIYNNYFSDLSDLELIKKGLRTFLRIENTSPFKSGQARFIKVPLEGCRHTTWGSNDYVECMSRHYTYPLSHMTGTCKMGPEWDRSAVVDPRLRVYGVSGLRVIDASIMPLTTRGNTNAPAIMIGEKGADLIKEDWLHNYIPGYVHGKNKET